ncbi:MAG TPA: glycosyltransferase [Bryobacteraceae bacterium]
MQSLSVVIPAHNEGSGLIQTVRSILQSRRSSGDVELVVADDRSDDGSIEALKAEFPSLDLTVVRAPERLGVARARNLAARAAQGDILFITDGHVQFCDGWDTLISQRADPSAVLAATIVDLESGFRGYGCRLVVPFMGTYWNAFPPDRARPVQIASSAGTVIYRETYQGLGGYDEGMRIYGGAEPEFSVRAWLSGLEIHNLPSLEVRHRFKPLEQRNRLSASRRVYMVHNNLRFGLLYLEEEMVLKTIRLMAWEFPSHAAEAFRMVEESDVFDRRAQIERTLPHSFFWFVERFGLKDQAGEAIRFG